MKISSKYKELYLSTGKQQIKQLSNLLLSLEKSPESQNLLEHIFRLVHSMKGAASTMGHRKTSKFFHKLETVIDSAYHQNLILNKVKIDNILNILEKVKDNFESIKEKDKELDFNKEIIQLNKLSKVSKIKVKKKVQGSKHILGSIPATAEINIPTHKLDDIQKLLDDLLINTLEIKSEIKRSGNSKVLSSYVNSNTILSSLRKEFEKLRIVPLSQIFSSLPYLVREIAKDEEKEVSLEIKDNGLSLDKGLIDEIVEILIQLLKNAVSHGISEKQKNGNILLETSLENDRIKIIVKDNGEGIDWQKVLKIAIKNKVISKKESNKLTLGKIKDLIFSLGFSSKKELSLTSGRGVGLSLVKSKVESLGGSIEVDSSKKGTTFTISLPIPLSVFNSIYFQLGDYTLAIPLTCMKEIVNLKEVEDFSKKKTYIYKKKKFKIIHLEKLFKIKGLKPLSKYIILLQCSNYSICIPVYSNIEEGELLMKRTPGIVKKMKYIKAIAISAQGKPILVLDINQFN